MIETVELNVMCLFIIFLHLFNQARVHLEISILHYRANEYLDGGHDILLKAPAGTEWAVR